MILTLAINTRNSGEVATPLSPLCVLLCKIGDRLTVSIDSLYSNLKAVTKPVDTNYSKAAFEDIKSCANKII